MTTSTAKITTITTTTTTKKATTTKKISTPVRSEEIVSTQEVVVTDKPSEAPVIDTTNGVPLNNQEPIKNKFLKLDINGSMV